MNYTPFPPHQISVSNEWGGVYLRRILFLLGLADLPLGCDRNLSGVPAWNLKFKKMKMKFKPPVIILFLRPNLKNLSHGLNLRRGSNMVGSP